MIPSAANCPHWSSRLVYTSCTGCWIIERNACETQDSMCCTFCVYTAAPESHRDATWERVLRKLSLLAHIPQWPPPPHQHTLKGLFVFASRCICVTWMISPLHLCHSDFHCKREMSGRKELIVSVWICVYILTQPIVHTQIHTNTHTWWRSHQRTASALLM